jgi:hypothetical protein
MRGFSVVMVLLGVVLAVVFSGVALGSGGGSSPIGQAAGKSANATSVKFDFTLAISTAGAKTQAGKLSLSGTGAADSKTKAVAVSLDLGSLAPLLAASAKGAAIPKSVDLVVVNNAVYVHLAALAKQLGAPGKQWVKLDLSKLPKSTTAGMNTKAVSSVSPQQAVAALQSALTVHKVGTDQYGTHYHGTLNLAGLLTILPASQRASAGAGFAKAGIKTVPFDAWVGGHGYLRRLTFSLTAKTTTAASATIAFTLNLHDYGVPVTISAPPANQTVDGSKLLATLAATLPKA